MIRWARILTSAATGIGLATSLSGCAAKAPGKAYFVQPAAFPVKPAKQRETHDGSIIPVDASGSPYGNQSTWQTGDIVTINVSFSTTAQNSDNGALKKSSSLDNSVTTLLGHGFATGGGFSPSISLSDNQTFSGKGSTSGSNAVTTELAAVVTDIKPNGILALAGRTNVNINGNVTGIEVTGFARPQDIGPNNTLSSSQLADANIQYVGVGDINSAHHVPWLQSTVSKYSPF